MTSSETTQSKYRKNRKPTDQPKIEDNEVRITTQGRVKKYVDYSLRLLQGIDPNAPNQRNQQGDKTEEKESGQVQQSSEDKSSPEKTQPEQKEKKTEETDTTENLRKFDTIVLKATGLAINKAVVTAEVVKRRIGGLHQVTELKTLEIEDTWEPIEEGLHVVKTTRRVASIILKLSCDSKEIDKMKNEPGYQAPIATESIKPGSGRRGIGGGIGGISGQQGGNYFGGGYRYRGGGFGGQGGNRRRGGPRGGRGNRQGYRGGGFSPNRGQNLGGGQQGGYRGGQQGGYRGGQGGGQRFISGGGNQSRRGMRGGGQGFRGGRGGGRGFRGGGMRNQQQGVRSF